MAVSGRRFFATSQLTPADNTVNTTLNTGSTARNPNAINNAPTIPIEKLSTNISSPGFTLPSKHLSTFFITHAPRGPITIPPISIVMSAPITTPIVASAPATSPRLS